MIILRALVTVAVVFMIMGAAITIIEAGSAAVRVHKEVTQRVTGES